MRTLQLRARRLGRASVLMPTATVLAQILEFDDCQVQSVESHALHGLQNF
jgi:hypothetical protein